MSAYYNDIDPGVCEWLRELIKAGCIPHGDVDCRPIQEIEANDVRGYTQQHFFAGIGGWAYALRLAGWSDDRAVRTASLPCQPFSVAGKQLGEDDERHLFPVYKQLVQDLGPAVTFGEQVASPAGRKWLSGVRAEMETLGYAFGAADLCTAGFGSPQMRQRLYWVADPYDVDGDGARFGTGDDGSTSLQGCVSGGRLGDTHGDGRQQGEQSATSPRHGRPTLADGMPWDRYDILPCSDGKARRIEPGTFPLVDGLPHRVALLRGYGNAICPQAAATFIQAWQQA